MSSSLLTLSDLTGASTSNAVAREALEAQSRLKKKSSIRVPATLHEEKAATRAEALASTVKSADKWEPLVREEVRSERLVFGSRKKLTKEAVKEQRSELAQARSEMHHAGQKAKYHSRVKSKAFARGRKKKQRERRDSAKEAAASVDPEAMKKLDEDKSKSRVEERSTLRHNSTSAWARGLKKRGKVAKDANRDASREQIELGQELRKKQDQDPDEEDDDDRGPREDEEPRGVFPSTVASMPFMQRALANQRKAKLDADKLVEELENASGDEDDKEDEDGLAKLKELARDDEELREKPFAASEKLVAGSLRVRRNDQNSWLEAAKRARTSTTRSSAVVLEEDEKVEAVSGARRDASKRKVKDMTQEDLVDLAFDDQVEEEFAAEKRQVEDSDDEKDDDMPDLPGWGSWTGDGVVDRKPRSRKRARVGPTDEKKKDKKKTSSPHVILNPKTMTKQHARLKVAQVPYPFTSRSQYEKYMAQPIGEEWNAKEAVEALTRPAVVVRRGVGIEPIASER